MAMVLVVYASCYVVSMNYLRVVGASRGTFIYL